MLGLCVTLKMFCMTLVITFVTLKNSPSWLKCVWCLSDCFYQSSHCIFSHQNLRCEMWFLGKFCSTLVIAFITLESFLTMLRVATLYHFVCFFYIILLPVPNWASAEAQFIPNFSFHTKFFIYHHITPNFSFTTISHQIFHFYLWFCCDFGHVQSVIEQFGKQVNNALRAKSQKYWR